MAIRYLVTLGIALWLLGLSLQTLAQETPAKVDVVAVAGSPGAGILTLALTIIVPGLITGLGFWLKHRADMRKMEELHAEMVADREERVKAQERVERRIDEDRERANRLADKDREDRRRVAQRVERVASNLTETTASAAAAVVETRDRLKTLVVASEKNAVVTGQIGELAAAMHALGNNAEDLRLTGIVDRAETKAKSGIKADIDALEKAVEELKGHREKQRVVDTQGGKGQKAGAASIKEASTDLAAGTTKEERS